MRSDYPITELCNALAVSSSGYHAARQRQKSPRTIENAQLLKTMIAIHEHRHTRAYGSPRMTHELRARGYSASENRVARLMRQSGLRARPRRPYRPRTTRPDHAAHPSPNLLAQAAPPVTAGTHLVSDITYIPTREGWLYLAVVIDLYSRAILGWKIADSLHADVVTAALRRALHTGHIAPGAIFHSDRGCQYTAASTRDILHKHELRQSMSAAGYCYDNAFAESAFASLKAELPDAGQPFPSKQAARSALFDYIETFYNRRRRHTALGCLSPFDYLKINSTTQIKNLN
jgi:putative transposase